MAIKFKGNENYTKAVKKTKIKVKSAFQIVTPKWRDKKIVMKIQRALKHPVQH